MISYGFLQHYWWIIISILAGLLVFLMFVQGGQSLIFSVTRNETQKTILVNALGRKWEFTFTTLVTFGGAFFASFPLFYATSFGGAYWVWIAILFSFIIQAIAYEYRSRPANIFGKRTYDIFLLLNGTLGPFLIGTATGTFFTGSQFSLDYLNHASWANNWHGLEALVNGRNLALGLAVLFLARTNGILYLINSIEEKDLLNNLLKKLPVNSVSFLVFFLFFLATLLTSDGFAVDPVSGNVTMEKFKYLHNFIGTPWVLILFLTGVILVLSGTGITLFKQRQTGIWFTGPGTIVAVFSLFIIAGVNGTSFYPSMHDLNSSLTIQNASSSYFTLKTMMFVSFIIPVVAWYIWYTWSAINKKKITESEMHEEGHVY